MAAVLNHHLLTFAVKLEKAINKALDEDPEFATIWAPIGVELHTIDGLTAKFLEEGIEFYPEEKK